MHKDATDTCGAADCLDKCNDVLHPWAAPHGPQTNKTHPSALPLACAVWAGSAGLTRCPRDVCVARSGGREGSTAVGCEHTGQYQPLQVRPLAQVETGMQQAVPLVTPRRPNASGTQHPTGFTGAFHAGDRCRQLRPWPTAATPWHGSLGSCCTGSPCCCHCCFWLLGVTDRPTAHTAAAGAAVGQLLVVPGPHTASVKRRPACGPPAIADAGVAAASGGLLLLSAAAAPLPQTPPGDSCCCLTGLGVLLLLRPADLLLLLRPAGDTPMKVGFVLPLAAALR